MKEEIVDIHCHPTFRTSLAAANPDNNPGGGKNPWNPTHNRFFDTSLGRWARMQSQDVVKTSQSNYSECAAGGVSVVIDSLYPLERNFINLRRIPKMVIGKEKTDQLLMTVTGIEQEMLDKLRSNGDYFPELQEQYELLSRCQGTSPDGKHAYQLARDFDHLVEIRKEKPNCIAVLTSIEGAHALGAGTSAYAGLTHRAHRELLSKNIKTVKSWASPPLFVNLSHHFWNQLAGHVRSIKPPTNNLINQSIGMNTGITELGWHVIEELLSTGNGRRVLIDTKHLSVKSRKEYYSFINRYNRINPQHKIPLVCSHTGVNGFPSMEASVHQQDNVSKMKNGGYFHTWAINLSNEEIRIIHDSGGLIGIMLDKGLLASITTNNRVREIQDPAAKKDAFIEMVWKNIFQVVRAVDNRSGWDVLSIGSDFDGVISHLDPYPSAASMSTLKADMVDWLERKEVYPKLWFGLSPQEMVKKVFGENAMQFLKVHFRDQPQSDRIAHPDLITV